MEIKNINIKKIAIIGGIAVVSIIVIVLLWKWLKAKLSDTMTEAQLNEVNKLEITTSDVTVTGSQMQSLISKLKAAFGRWGWGTDEEAIYEVFDTVNSRSDILTLIKEFGVVDGHTLTEWLNNELNASERQHLQEIIAAKGINYQF